MKTVRFSKIVNECGKPEVYLLLSETDAVFLKAVHAHKVMSLSGDAHGAGTEYGTVGYDKKRKGQLLLFPKTLKAFEERKVIGLKYDLFAEENTSGHSPKKKSAVKEPSKKEKKANVGDVDTSTIQEVAKPPSRKIVPFSKPGADEEESHESVFKLKGYARQAMRALEKNNAVAAYNLLKRITGE